MYWRHYVFGLSVCECVRACILFAWCLTNQRTEFQAGRWCSSGDWWTCWLLKVKVTVGSNIWVSYCSEWKHPNRTSGIEVLSSSYVDLYILCGVCADTECLVLWWKKESRWCCTSCQGCFSALSLALYYYQTTMDRTELFGPAWPIHF